MHKAFFHCYSHYCCHYLCIEIKFTCNHIHAHVQGRVQQDSLLKKTAAMYDSTYLVHKNKADQTNSSLLTFYSHYGYNKTKKIPTLSQIRWTFQCRHGLCTLLLGERSEPYIDKFSEKNMLVCLYESLPYNTIVLYALCA